MISIDEEGIVRLQKQIQELQDTLQAHEDDTQDMPAMSQKQGEFLIACHTAWQLLCKKE